ncbi:hypothetical protein HMPREF0043_01584 [Actinobaculum sp. oral taxon 183 str. F0552]|nr:hypothetical protein HMPREF0043_01584 [Actinobaculum sp. oral taxon 183 str. F0552]
MLSPENAFGEGDRSPTPRRSPPQGPPSPSFRAARPPCRSSRGGRSRRAGWEMRRKTSRRPGDAQVSTLCSPLTREEHA